MKDMNNVKTVLLIGSTGSGKSTLANTIIGKDKFEESAGSISKTKKVQIEEFEENGIKYQIVDTVGIGDTGMTLEKVLRKLALMGYSVKDGVSQILFVIDGVMKNEAKSTYDLLSKIIFDENIAKYTTVIRTRFSGFRDRRKCEEDKKEIIKKDKILGELIEGSKGIIYVDNPPLIINDEESSTLSKNRRKESRKALLDHLKFVYQGESYKPANLDKLSNMISEHMEEKKRLKEEMNKLNKGKSKSEGWKDDFKEGLLSGQKWLKMLGLAKKNSALNRKITKKMVEHIEGIDSELKREIETDLKQLKDEKTTNWKWFKSSKIESIWEELTDNQTLIEDFIGKVEKIGEESEELQLQIFNKEEELEKSGELLNRFTNSQKNIVQQIQEKKAELESLKDDYLKKHGNYSSEKLQENLEKLLKAQKDNGTYANEHKNELKKKLIKKTLLSAKELDNLCQVQEKLLTLELELGTIQGNIRETQERITFVKSIMITPFSPFKVPTSEEADLHGVFLELLRQVLLAKKTFLTARQGTIKKLQEVYNKSTSRKHTNIDAFGNVLNEVGGIPVTLGVPQIVGGIIKIGNGIWKQKSWDKHGKQFLNLLEEEEEQLPQINNTHEQLIQLVRSNQNLRDWELVKTFQLVDKTYSEEPKLFDTNYKVFEVDMGVWEGKPLTAEKMEGTIKLLSENLGKLKNELEKERKKLKIWEEERLETKIEHSPYPPQQFRH
jgi:predicted GTPase